MKFFSATGWRRICVLLLVTTLLVVNLNAVPLQTKQLVRRTVDDGDNAGSTSEFARTAERPSTPHPRGTPRGRQAEIPPELTSTQKRSSKAASRLRAWMKKQRASAPRVSTFKNSVKARLSRFKKIVPSEVQGSLARIRTGLTRSKKPTAPSTESVRGQARLTGLQAAVAQNLYVKAPEVAPAQKTFMKAPETFPIQSFPPADSRIKPRVLLPDRPWLPSWAVAKPDEVPGSSRPGPKIVAASPPGKTELTQPFSKPKAGEFTVKSTRPKSNAFSSVDTHDIPRGSSASSEEGSIFHTAPSSPLTSKSSSPESSFREPLQPLRFDDHESSSSDESRSGRKRHPAGADSSAPKGGIWDLPSSPEQAQLETERRPWRSFKSKLASIAVPKDISAVAEEIKAVPHLVKRAPMVIYSGFYPGEYIQVHRFEPRNAPARYHFVHVNAINAAASSVPWSSLSREFKAAVTEAIPNARKLGKGRGTPEELGISISNAYDLNGPKYPYPGRHPRFLEVIQVNGEHLIRSYASRGGAMVDEIRFSNAPRYLTTWLFQRDNRIGRFLLRRDLPDSDAAEITERAGKAMILHKRDPHLVWENYFSGEYISIRRDASGSRYIFQFEPAPNTYQAVRAETWANLTPEEQDAARMAIPYIDDVVEGRKTPRQAGIRLTQSFGHYDKKRYVYPGRGPRYLRAFDYGNGNIIFEQLVSKDDAPFETSTYARLQPFLQKYVSIIKPELTSVLRPPLRTAMQGDLRPDSQGSSSSTAPGRSAFEQGSSSSTPRRLEQSIRSSLRDSFRFWRSGDLPR